MTQWVSPLLYASCARSRPVHAHGVDRFFDVRDFLLLWCVYDVLMDRLKQMH